MGRCSRAWPRKRKPVEKRWRAIRRSPAKGYRSPPHRPAKPHPRTGDSREPICEILDRNDNVGRALLRSIAEGKHARNEKVWVRCETGASSIWTMPTCARGSTGGTKVLGRGRRIGLLDARRFTIRAVWLGRSHIPQLCGASRGTGARHSDGYV